MSDEATRRDAAPGRPRRRAVGAEPGAGGVDFRVWAPDHDRVLLVVEQPRSVELEMRREATGHHSLFVPELGAGALYRYRVPGSDKPLPDPASRFQPEGPHGPSQVVDPGAYAWKSAPPAIDPRNAIVYEMHVGTFTLGGTWDAAIRELRPLAELGVTILEVMPVNEFAGTFGWGYDGVDLWAPTRNYGRPDDFRRFVDEAHALGLGVILDVVYNHMGPDGCYLTGFAKNYFTKRYENEWGDAINFDGEESEGVREFFVENAACWIDEYRLDGLRVDATQSIHDAGPRHVLGELTTAARRAAGDRPIFLVAENEPQELRLFRTPEEGGFGFDAAWNDDFHHTAVVALTGKREAYYSDYTGSAREFVAAARHGFLFQGQRYAWQDKRRGSIVRGVDPRRFVWCLENHDQVANSASGRRLRELASPARYRALVALVLLGPATPMLFQGEELGSLAPFLYFADHEPELAALVRKGRLEFMAQFPSVATRQVSSRIADPADRAAFERCRLDRSTENRQARSLYRDLLRLRREQAALRSEFDAAALSDEAFLIRWFGERDDLLLLVNLGRQLNYEPAPEPLLAPCGTKPWETIWSSEWPQYGGNGTAAPETEKGWVIPAESAVLLRSGGE